MLGVNAGPWPWDDAVGNFVYRAIETQAWSQSAAAFTQSFGSDGLDASALMLPIVGFLPGTDPRVRATIDAIDAGLNDSRGLGLPLSLA